MTIEQSNEYSLFELQCLITLHDISFYYASKIFINYQYIDFNYK